MKHFNISLPLITFLFSLLVFTACQQEQEDTNQPNIQLKSESGFVIADSELALNQLVKNALEELSRSTPFSIVKTEIQETQEYVGYSVYFLGKNDVEDLIVFNFSKNTDGKVNKQLSGAVVCMCSCTEGVGKCKAEIANNGGCLCEQSECEGDCALFVASTK